MGTVTSVVTGIGSLLAGVTAPIWGLVAAVTAVVLGLALAVYNYWVPISEFVSGFAEEIGEALSSLVSRMTNFAGEIASAVGSWAKQKIIDIGELLGIDAAVMEAAIDHAVQIVRLSGKRVVDAVRAIPDQIGNWFSDIFTMNEYSDAETAEFRAAGQNFARSIIDGIGGLFETFSWPGIIPSIEWGEIVGAFNWEGLLPEVNWSAIWGAIEWPQELKSFDWQQYIPNFEWSDVLLLTIPGAINALIEKFAGINLFDAGVKAMQSLWDGMMSLVDRMVASIKAKLANLMPSMPAWFSGSGGTEKVQKKASGGRFGRGPLLVGEQGPELEYSNRSGFIAHHQQLKNMVSMSRQFKRYAAASTVAAGVAAAPVAGVAAAPLLPDLKAAEARASASRNIQISVPVSIGNITANDTNIAAQVEAVVNRAVNDAVEEALSRLDDRMGDD